MALLLLRGPWTSQHHYQNPLTLGMLTSPLCSVDLTLASHPSPVIAPSPRQPHSDSHLQPSYSFSFSPWTLALKSYQILPLCASYDVWLLLVRIHSVSTAKVWSWPPCLSTHFLPVLHPTAQLNLKHKLQGTQFPLSPPNIHSHTLSLWQLFSKCGIATWTYIKQSMNGQLLS